jgi:FkbM family methyltransferase
VFVSYAQNFEDVMLWRALRHIEHGFYVDIGANDPVVESVSKAFYDRGWRGVHVEPVAEYARLLREARPDEEVIEKAVGAESGAMTLHVIPGTGLSSLVEASALSAVALRGYERAEVVVPVVTLDELLLPYAGRDIHWLKVDVEGAELDVLRGWNARRDRPWIMVVEATVPNSQEDCHQAWEPILLDADYRFVYFDGLSRFYVSVEHGELASSFRTPPNYFDQFIRADLVAAMTAQAEAARQCEEIRGRAQELTLQLGAAREQLAAVEELSHARHHLLEQAAAQMERLAADNGQLNAELRHARFYSQELESKYRLESSRAQDAEARRQELEARLEEELRHARFHSQEVESKYRSESSRAQDAEARRQELAARVEAAEIRERESGARAVVAEAMLAEVYRSRSWRVTRPVRAMTSAARKVKTAHSLIPTDLKKAGKDMVLPLIVRLLRFAQTHPEYKARALTLIRRLPKIEERLRAMALARGLIGAQAPTSIDITCDEAPADFAYMSPPARRIYANLKAAVALQNRQAS